MQTSLRRKPEFVNSPFSFTTPPQTPDGFALVVPLALAGSVTAGGSLSHSARSLDSSPRCAIAAAPPKAARLQLARKIQDGWRRWFARFARNCWLWFFVKGGSVFSAFF